METDHSERLIRFTRQKARLMAEANAAVSSVVIGGTLILLLDIPIPVKVIGAVFIVRQGIQAIRLWKRYLDLVAEEDAYKRANGISKSRARKPVARPQTPARP